MEWINENWGTISLVVLFLINVLNATTRNFKEHKGLVKVCLFIVDVLSVASSLNSKGTGKLPGTVSKGKQ